MDENDDIKYPDLENVCHNTQILHVENEISRSHMLVARYPNIACQYQNSQILHVNIKIGRFCM